MTLSTKHYIPMKTSEKKGYLKMDPADIWKAEGCECKVESPVFSTEVVYEVSGTIYHQACDCYELDIDEAEDKDWTHCPYCGESLREYIHKDFSTEDEALKSKEYKRIGILLCRLAVTARTQNMMFTGGLFA